LLWWSVWTLIALVAILGVAGYFAKWKLIVQATRVLSAIFALLLLVVSGFIKGYLGDAARYLDARPSNIALRRRIRSDGISLLRRLHDCGEYDRIVMVGHSLGTIIAYDILKHYWVEVNTSHGPLLDLRQEALKALQLSGASLSGDASPAAVDGFQEKQIQLWLEQRRLGNSWLVTDLVSLGSPLAHGAILLARNEAELRQRQSERELPTCPPAEDEHSYYYSLNYSVGDDKRTIRVLHHAAHFACTRWTNLYFPAKWGFFGDLVGGPLRDVFGHGIKDVPLTSDVGLGLLQYTPLIHTHYWEGEARACTDERAHNPPALENLLRALDLDSKKWLAQVGPVKTKPKVEPSQPAPPSSGTSKSAEV